MSLTAGFSALGTGITSLVAELFEVVGSGHNSNQPSQISGQNSLNFALWASMYFGRRSFNHFSCSAVAHDCRPTFPLGALVFFFSAVVVDMSGSWNGLAQINACICFTRGTLTIFWLTELKHQLSTRRVVTCFN
jgi:hypothetical protein